jgi:glycosyltransferase involved in cell wall biosynthesis
MNPLISVVIPCYRSIGRVNDTLEAIANQTAHGDTYEVLVIGNSQEDKSFLHNLVLDIFQRAGKQRTCRFVFEPAMGLCNARNRGVAEAKGEYVLFLDDDAVPLCSYIHRMAEAICHEKPDVIGGSLIAFPEAALQNHHDAGLAPWWSLRHFGQSSRWLTGKEYFLGANIGAKRDILLERGFDRNLGRMGESLIGGEEVWLGEAQFRRWYCAGAPVFHKVSFARMQPAYLGRRLACNFSRRVLPGDFFTWIHFLLVSVLLSVRNTCTQFAFRLKILKSAIGASRQIKQAERR